MIICPFKDLKRYAPVLPGLEEALEKIGELTSLEPATYPLSGGNRFFVCAGKTVPVGLAEAHRKYLDIQYMIRGHEVMGWADVADCQLQGEFNTEGDIGMYAGDFRYLNIGEGMCYVAFPEDAHMPSRYLDEENDFVKIVVKLAV